MNVFIFGIIVITMILSYYVTYENGYEKGQKDMLIGKQKCKLVEFPDGTRAWRLLSDIPKQYHYKIIQ